MVEPSPSPLHFSRQEKGKDREPHMHRDPQVHEGAIPAGILQSAGSLAKQSDLGCKGDPDLTHIISDRRAFNPHMRTAVHFQAAASADKTESLCGRDSQKRRKHRRR
ncbi:hypothetical protein E1B28_007437 [Marasmius oreades]|uniref:Uncharacterized protein n=1 Tax=Marasmius oreades TaxID=181124 RepID=A0A9P7S1U7_9AGAR|nr:uncharacterized protein E1B28_007437 [Marasmius oreades]KAG7093792.1 hypothetical protein E1B28_007437 [Marasmius oreades]